jgi:hypothetical protein
MALVSQKVSWLVTPAKAGVQNILNELNSGFRRNDRFKGISTFYMSVKGILPLSYPSACKFC